MVTRNAPVFFFLFGYNPSFSLSQSSRVSLIPARDIYSMITSLNLFCRKTHHYAKQACYSLIKLDFPLLVTPRRFL